MNAQARSGVTTIVIADDHPVVRQGLQTLLLQEPGFRIIGEASDGFQTIEMVKRLKPAVLILDLMMPDISGMEVTRRIRKCSRRTHIVILSMYSNEAYVLETLRNGAEGYVLKDSPGTSCCMRSAKCSQDGVTSVLHCLSAPWISISRRSSLQTLIHMKC